MSSKSNEVAIILSMKDQASKQINKFSTRSRRAFGAIKKSVFSLKSAFIGMGAALVFKGMLQKTVEQEQAMRQVQAAVKSTGGAAGLSARQIGEMARGFQDVTTFGDEAILRVQSKILTFTGITKENFGATTEAVLDLATRMEGDLTGAVVQLGKVLNDPVANLGSLSRVGIQFTETDKKMIKTLAKSGDLLGAQAIILKELNKEFGGSARAARDTFGGALEGLKNKFGDLLEAKGGLRDARQEIEKITATMGDPAFVSAANTVTSTLISGFSEVLGVIRPVAESIKSMKIEIEAMAAFSLGQISFIELMTSSNEKLKVMLGVLNPVITATETHTEAVTRSTEALAPHVAATGADADAVRALLSVTEQSIQSSASAAVQDALGSKSKEVFASFVMLASRAQLQETQIVLQEIQAKNKQTIATLRAGRATAIAAGEMQNAAAIIQQIIAAENGGAGSAQRLRDVTDQLAQTNRDTISSYFALTSSLGDTAAAFNTVAAAADNAGRSQSKASRNGGGKSGQLYRPGFGLEVLRNQLETVLRKQGVAGGRKFIRKNQQFFNGPAPGTLTQFSQGLRDINKRAIDELARTFDDIVSGMGLSGGVNLNITNKIDKRQVETSIANAIRSRTGDVYQALRDIGINPVTTLT